MLKSKDKNKILSKYGRWTERHVQQEWNVRERAWKSFHILSTKTYESMVMSASIILDLLLNQYSCFPTALSSLD